MLQQFSLYDLEGLQNIENKRRYHDNWLVAFLFSSENTRWDSKKQTRYGIYTVLMWVSVCVCVCAHILGRSSERGEPVLAELVDNNT